MLSKRILVLVFVVAFLFVGCIPTPTPPNEAPIITSTPVTTATIGVLYTYDVNATDPDGDTLTYSLSVKPTGMTINSANGLIKWIPVAAQIGNNSVTVKVSDGTLSITQGFIIKVSKPTPTPINHAPVITPIPNLTATVGVVFAYDVNATDPDGDTLTYSLSFKPTNMTINSANGVIIWVPTLAQVGNNSVIVEVTDGALSDTQGFTITVSKPTPTPINQAPTINSTPSLTAIVGVEYTYTIKATDPDGDAITYSLVSPWPVGMTFDAPATINWIPTSTQIGNNNVTVKASDGKLSTPQSFTITVNEHELIRIGVEPNKVTLLTGGTQQLKVTAYYDDENHDDITSICTYVPSNPNIALVNVNGLVTAGDCGIATITVTYSPEGIVFADIVEVTVGPVQNIDKPGYYNTIQAAIVEASDGETIEVAAGTYTEDVNITKPLQLLGAKVGVPAGPDASPAGRSDPVEESIIDGYIRITGVGETVIDGFTILNEEQHVIDLDGGGDVIKNNIIDGVSVTVVKSGIFSRGNGGYLITNNNIRNCGRFGITFDGGDPAPQCTISGNYITNITGRENTAGIQTMGSWSNGHIFSNNLIENCGAGIVLAQGEHQVSGNTIRDNSGSGILLWAAEDATRTFGIQITQNTIEGNVTGIKLWPDWPTAVDNVAHFNNIVGNADGVVNEHSAVFDATDNWWGDASGPSGGVSDPVEGITADGSGDSVSSKVRFAPWSIE